MAIGMTDLAFLTSLEATLRERRGADPKQSYVAKLHAKGIAKIAKKLGEEAVETVIAALAEDDAALTGEAADLVFHLLTSSATILPTHNPGVRRHFERVLAGRGVTLHCNAEVKTVRNEGPKVGRNDPCPCGSGKKYKKCHGAAS